MKSLILDAARRASRYLHGVNDRPVAPTPEALAGLMCFKGEMPDRETAADAVLEMLDAFGSPATIVNAGGRYFGFVNGGATPAALAANVLAAAWDRNTALRVMSPVGAVLEDTALRWISNLLRLPAAAVYSSEMEKLAAAERTFADTLAPSGGGPASLVVIVRRCVRPRLSVCNFRSFRWHQKILATGGCLR